MGNKLSWLHGWASPQCPPHKRVVLGGCHYSSCKPHTKWQQSTLSIVLCVAWYIVQKQIAMQNHLVYSIVLSELKLRYNVGYSGVQL
jgi:hypothetical protein